jgi:pantothenate kinase
MSESKEPMFLFTQVMAELRDIKTELKDLNRTLATTVERQATDRRDMREIQEAVKVLADNQRECPARVAIRSRNHIVKESSTWFALILSITAVWRTFWS